MMQIQANGRRNAQVTNNVKDAIYGLIERYGVDDPAGPILMTHFRDGEFVSVSRKNYMDDIAAWSRWQSEVVEEHEQNRQTNEDTVWLHREWIAQYLFD